MAGLSHINPMDSYSKQDLRRLERLSHDKARSSHFEVNSLYRNKPSDYFDQIRSGNGVMHPRLKDSGGDPRCPLNGDLSGLFFLGWQDRYGNRPSRSPFGNRRIIIPISYLFTNDHNLYFADFYCMSNPEHHYVTLVVTEPESEADEFCESHLHPLDNQDNPYMYLSDEGEVYMAQNLWVEVFYTEAININKGHKRQGFSFEYTDIMGSGQSKPDGIPKNFQCCICNLR